MSDVAAWGVVGGFLDEVSEVVGGHEESVGAILDGRYAEFGLQLVVVVGLEELFEACERVCIFDFSCHELSFVEALAVAEYEFDIAEQYSILLFVGGFFDFFFELLHESDVDSLFVVGHVECFSDAVFEEGVFFDIFFEVGAVQEVGVEE